MVPPSSRPRPRTRSAPGYVPGGAREKISGAEGDRTPDLQTARRRRTRGKPAICALVTGEPRRGEARGGTGDGRRHQDGTKAAGPTVPSPCREPSSHTACAPRPAPRPHAQTADHGPAAELVPWACPVPRSRGSSPPVRTPPTVSGRDGGWARFGAGSCRNPALRRRTWPSTRSGRRGSDRPSPSRA